MKKIVLLLLISLITNISFSQSPDSFSYQCILRDVNGQPVPLQAVDIRFSILQGSSSGPSVYSETHATLTNDFGLINLFIGQGISVDNMSLIDWSNGPFFAFVEADPDNTGFQVVTTTQMMSVPYSLYAKYGEDPDSDPTNEYNTSAVLIGTDLQILDAGGTQTVDLSSLSNSGTDDQNISGSGLAGTTLTIGIENGTNETVDLSSLQDGVDDADNDPTNEYNTGAVLSGTDLEITDAGGTQTVDLSSLTDDGDWTISGNDIYNSNTGNVGVGTTTPSEKLDVVGNVEFSGSLEPNAFPGNPGDVLVSQGAGVAPVWQAEKDLVNLLSVVGTTDISIAANAGGNGFVLMDEMTITFTPNHSPVMVSFTAGGTYTNSNYDDHSIWFEIRRDGVAVREFDTGTSVNWNVWEIGLSYPVDVTVGASTTISIHWDAARGSAPNTTINCIPASVTYSARALQIWDAP